MNARAHIAAAALFAASPALAQVGTSITYQGRLDSGGQPAGGIYDLQFRLFDAPLGGSQVGPTLCSEDVVTQDGFFTVSLDFGDQYSRGAALYLQVALRPETGLTCATPTGFTTLAPLQAFTITPFAGLATRALASESADTASNASLLGGQNAAFYRNAANLNSGTILDARLSVNIPKLNTANTFTGAISLTNVSNVIAGDGGGLTGLNASNLTSGSLPGQALSGNYFNTVQLTNTNNTLAGTHSGNGSALTGLNASSFTVGVLAPARGGTGTQVTSATTGDVLKWNGVSFTAQADQNTTYSAGSGLTLLGTVFSIGPSQVTGGMLAAGTVTSANIADGTLSAADIGPNAVGSPELALDAASMLRVSGGAVSSSGSNIGIGIAAGADRLRVNGAMAVDGTSTLTGNVGIGGAPATSKLNVVGSANVTGTVTAAALVTTPTARSLILSAADFTGDAKIVFDNTGLNPTNLHFLTCGSTIQGTNGYAPVHLPHGAVVTGLTVYAVDSSVLANVSVFLIRRTPDNTDPGGTLANLTTSGSDSAIRAFADTTVSGGTINNSTSMYYVRVDFPLGASLYLDNPNLVAVKIDYTTTTP